MKKNVFMVMVLSLVFLGIGNISFAAINCGDGTMCPCNSDCDDLGDGSYVCKSPSQCPVGNVLEDGNQESIILDTPCNVGALSGDKYAIVSMGVSCKCKTSYGEYVDPSNGKVSCQLCSRSDVCCGTKLNTKIPFIGDCIESSTQASGSVITETTAFPILVTALVKILISVILVASFILIIVAGVMIATGDAKGGKDMIIKVAIGLAILGASGVILRLINPNFFG